MVREMSILNSGHRGSKLALSTAPKTKKNMNGQPLFLECARKQLVSEVHERLGKDACLNRAQLPDLEVCWKPDRD